MTSWFDIVLAVYAALLLPPFLLLALEALAAFLPTRSSVMARPAGLRCAVLIPAHNEEECLTRTLESASRQLGPEDWLLVVADNCTDQTAEKARAGGAVVVERSDPARRGKGYALDAGVRSLAERPPDVVVILDADCLVAPEALDRLIAEVARTGRPVQAAYVFELPPGASVRSRLSAFACRFKNLVRPLGLHRLGFPCLLAGTGMAFPWQLLRTARLASGNIVEDIQLGVDLAGDSRPPLFCEHARVVSFLPSEPAAAFHQRTRWEHGHLRTLLTQTPRLLAASCRLRRLDLFALALDLSIPPLSILALLFAAGLGLWTLSPGLVSGVLLGSTGMAALAVVLASWFHVGKDCLPFPLLLAAPFYVVAKIPIYLAFFLRPQRAWVRTARNLPSPAADPEPKG